MCGFIRKAPARDGGYLFDGTHYMTRSVRETLSPVEYFYIVKELEDAVYCEKGVGKIQVYKAVGDDREVWAVDDVTHWTMMMADEALAESLSQRSRRQALPVNELSYA